MHRLALSLLLLVCLVLPDPGQAGRRHTKRVSKKAQGNFVLVVDRSGSMNGKRIAMAKQGILEFHSKLARRMELGLVIFDSTPTTLLPMTAVSNRAAVVKAVKKIEAVGGTEILPALKAGWDLVAKGGSKGGRHVILLSDGQSNNAGIIETVKAMVDDGVAVTTLALGQGADRKLLEKMAEEGHGRFYFVDHPPSLPSIMASMAWGLVQ